jgi:hypothetical protein
MLREIGQSNRIRGDVLGLCTQVDGKRLISRPQEVPVSVQHEVVYGRYPRFLRAVLEVGLEYKPVVCEQRIHQVVDCCREIGANGLRVKDRCAAHEAQGRPYRIVHLRRTGEERQCPGCHLQGGGRPLLLGVGLGVSLFLTDGPLSEFPEQLPEVGLLG